MTRTVSKIRFKAQLLQPAKSGKGDDWTFLVLPKNASAKLPTRSMTAIEGTINGFQFLAVLEPDGQKSHWLKVNRKLSKVVGAKAGDEVTLEIAPVAEEPEPEVPVDLCKALATAEPKAGSVWEGITTNARRDWILDRFRQASRDARTPDQKCLLDASGREATSLLLRPFRILQQKLERS